MDDANWQNALRQASFIDSIAAVVFTGAAGLRQGAWTPLAITVGGSFIGAGVAMLNHSSKVTGATMGASIAGIPAAFLAKDWKVTALILAADAVGGYMGFQNAQSANSTHQTSISGGQNFGQASDAILSILPFGRKLGAITRM